MRLSGWWFLLATAAAVLLPLAVMAGEGVSEDAFAGVARQEGEALAVARGHLERRGRELIPLLRQKAASTDWRERGLAGDLLLRIEKPEEAARLTQALTASGCVLTPGAQRTVEAKFSKPADSDATGGLQAPAVAVAVTFRAEHVSFIIGLLRADLQAQTAGIPRGEIWEQGLTVLKHLAAPEAVPALLDFSSRCWQPCPELVKTIAAAGPAAAQCLREVLRTETTTRPESDPETSQQNLAALLRCCAAALALAQIGDRESIPLLVERLKAAPSGREAEAYCTALGQLQAVEALPLVFAELIKTLDPPQTRNWPAATEHPEYLALRIALLTYGAQAADFLKTRQTPACPLSERVAATGLLSELADPEKVKAFHLQLGRLSEESSSIGRLIGKVPDLDTLDDIGPDVSSSAEKEATPVERDVDLDARLATGRRSFWSGWYLQDGVTPPPALLVELAHATGRFNALLAATRLKNQPLAYEVVASAVKRQRFSGKEERPQLIVALVEMGDERVIEVLAELLLKQYLEDRKTEVEALLLFDNPKAVPVLEELIRQYEGRMAAATGRQPAPGREGKAAADLARAVLPALKGEPGHLLKLLDSEQPSVRLTAARVLARRGEAKALEVLIPAALAARGEEHLDLRDAIVRVGTAGLDELDRRQKNATDLLERVLCESAALRIRNPELVQRTERARVDHHGFGNCGGPDIHDYRKTGRRYAEAAGREALPLFEAALAFNAGTPCGGTALFAVSFFKEDRSIPVLLAAVKEQRLVARDVSLAAVALNEFGEKGAEAARKIPAPVADKASFGERASRHQTAAETLVLAKDADGLEKVLEGLREPQPARKDNEYRKWSHRQESFLRLARNYHDPRIVDAVLPHLDQKNDDDLWAHALKALAAYDDPRIVPAAARFLDTGESIFNTNPAVFVLVKRLGDGIGPFLVKRLREGESVSACAGAAKALGQLFHRSVEYYGYRETDQPAREKALATLRELAVEPLSLALNDPDPPVVKAAAESLAALAALPDGTCDRRAVKALSAWVRTQTSPAGYVVDLLQSSRDPEAADALLAAYHLGHEKEIWLAAAAAALGNADAIAAVAAALRDRLRKKDFLYGIPELSALGSAGPAGLAELLAIFRECSLARIRTPAALEMAKRAYRDGFVDVKNYCDELIAAGPWNPQLDHAASQSGRPDSSELSSVTHALASIDPEQAYPYLCGAMLRIQDKEVAQRLGWSLQRLEVEHPALKKLVIPFTETKRAVPQLPAQDLPRVRLLEVYDLWREAAAGRDNEVDEGSRTRLLAAGDEALDALLELCRRPEPPSDRELADSIAALDREETRARAVSLLSLRPYSADVFDRVLVDVKPPALGYALAIRKWREEVGPWPLCRSDRIASAGHMLLGAYWPLDRLLRYTKAHLDQVVKIKDTWTLRLFLASLRYSPDAADRERLTTFADQADAHVAKIARDLMPNGLKDYYGIKLADHWRDLPPHEYK